MILVIARILTAAYALLFTGAALGKIDGWESWRTLTRGLPFPAALRSVAAFGVPAAEIVTAVTIFLVPAVGLVIAAALLVFFASAAWALTPTMAGEECNCFGLAMPSQINHRLVTRDLLLAVGAAAGALAATSGETKRMSLLELVALLVIGVTLLMVSEFRHARRSFRRVGPGVEDPIN